MFQQATRANLTLRLMLVAAICVTPVSPLINSAQAQKPGQVNFKISARGQQLEMVVNSSRILEMDFRVPRVLVENQSVLKANPISPTQIQLAAAQPGVTHVTLWDEKGKVHSLDVVVIPDARELEYLLKSQFPAASLKVRPLTSSVAISGYCPSAPMVSSVIAMAKQYFPTVINNIEIGGAQQVLLHVKVLEVSRTKLRTLGVDWALFQDHINLASKPSGLLLSETVVPGAAVQAAGSTLSYGVTNGTTRFLTFLEALRRNNLLKVLSEPTLTTVSGRAASFNVGGEFPILVPQSLGTVSIEYRQFGTRVDFVPIVKGNGEIRLEVRPQVSEIDSSRSVTVQNSTIPGLRSRWVDTAAEMRAGQTLALAGLLQTRVESETRSVPVLGDLPGVGGMFRRVEEAENEVELLIMVTPELVEPMDKHETPKCGPGQFTRTPSDSELYQKGWMEVPKCCGQCGKASCSGNCSGRHQAPAPSNMQVQLQHDVPGVPQIQYDGASQSPAPIITPNAAPGPVEVVPAPNPTPSLHSPSLHSPSTNTPFQGAQIQTAPYGSGVAQPSTPQVVQSQPSVYGSGVAPVITPDQIQRQAQATQRPASYAPVPAGGTPGLIGPSGYDELR